MFVKLQYKLPFQDNHSTLIHWTWLHILTQSQTLTLPPPATSKIPISLFPSTCKQSKDTGPGDIQTDQRLYWPHGIGYTFKDVSLSAQVGYMWVNWHICKPAVAFNSNPSDVGIPGGHREELSSSLVCRHVVVQVDLCPVQVSVCREGRVAILTLLPVVFICIMYLCSWVYLLRQVP